MKKTILTIGAVILAAALISVAETACAEKTAKVEITESEKASMAIEAEDFIDEINDGRQDQQSDAVVHAMRGQTTDLLNLRKSRLANSSTGEMISKTDIQGDGAARGISMRLYKSEKSRGKNLPLLIYFHGGGWTIGGLNSCDAFCDSLASTGKMAVLSVDYSLAPENTFPKGLLDCVSAIEYAFSHAKEWGCSPDRISVGGDSAGGNLAIASVLYRQKESGSNGKIRSILTFYPVVKAYNDGSESWKRYSRGYGLDGRLMEAFNKAYIGNGDVNDPLVSPADAGNKELATLPPLLLVAAERDILADQGKEFVDKVNTAGGKVERVELPGTVHLFITIDGQPTARKKAADIATEFIQR